MMNQNLIHTIYLAGAFLALFALAEFFYYKLKFHAEVTRKIVHAGTGVLTLLFPELLTHKFYVLALCGSFLILLLLSKKYNFLKSINAVPRTTHGSILYPIVVSICFIAFQYSGKLVLFYIPILTLAFSDPLAAFIGKKWPFGRYKILGHTKTASGSAAFFFSAVLISVLCLVFMEDAPLKTAFYLALVVAFVTTIAEGVSFKGFDNLTIPMGALATLWLIFLLL